MENYEKATKEAAFIFYQINKHEYEEKKYCELTCTEKKDMKLWKQGKAPTKWHIKMCVNFFDLDYDTLPDYILKVLEIRTSEKGNEKTLITKGGKIKTVCKYKRCEWAKNNHCTMPVCMRG